MSDLKNYFRRMKRRQFIDLTDEQEGEDNVASNAPNSDTSKNAVETVKKETTQQPLKRHKKNSIWQPFYLNAVRRISSSYNQNCIRFSDYFSFEDDNPFQDVLLMNYMMDIEWMLDQAPHLIDKNVFGLHAQRDNYYEIVKLPTWTVAKVDLGMERYGTHHSKMAIIFYQTGVRIVITTANFIQEDYDSLTQGNYIQDFPLKGHPSTVKTDFEKTLIEYLQRISATSRANMKLLTFIQRLSTDYDFSAAEVVLIPSVPGRHSATNLKKWGIGKLSSVLEENGYLQSSSEQSNWPLILQYSSLGSMGKDGKYIDELGRSMITTNKTASVCRLISCVWPTVETVRQSFLVSLHDCLIYNDKIHFI
jgi:hypothetical protein